MPRKPPPKPDSLKSRASKPMTMAELERTPEDKKQDRRLLNQINQQRNKRR